MHGDGRVNQITTERPQPCQRSILVGASKPAVSDHIRSQDCHELPGFDDGTLCALPLLHRAQIATRLDRPDESDQCVGPAERRPAQVAHARRAGIVAVRSLAAMSKNHRDKLRGRWLRKRGSPLGPLLALVRHRQRGANSPLRQRDGEPLRRCRGLGYWRPVTKSLAGISVDAARPRSFTRRRKGLARSWPRWRCWRPWRPRWWWRLRFGLREPSQQAIPQHLSFPRPFSYPHPHLQDVAQAAYSISPL
jgi:hypothetical protein